MLYYQLQSLLPTFPDSGSTIYNETQGELASLNPSYFVYKIGKKKW